MSELVLASDPAALDAAENPAEMVVRMLEQSKLLLAQASRLEDVTEWRAKADAIATYTRQRDLGREAELSAAEIVRRCERRIGQLIREGQERGEIGARGSSRPFAGNQHVGPAPEVNDTTSSPREFLGTGGKTQAEIYAMTDGVSDEEFETAIDEAKGEGNLSRANVVRKTRKSPPPATPTANRATPEDRAEQIAALAAQSMTSRQIGAQLGVSAERVRLLARENGVEIPADAVVGKTRRIDPNRVVEETVITADGLVTALKLVNVDELDVDRIPGWVDSLTASIRSLNQTIKAMKELTRD